MYKQVYKHAKENDILKRNAKCKVALLILDQRMLRPPPPPFLANFYFWWFCVTFTSLTDSGQSIARHPLTELITHTFIDNIAISRKTDCRQMLLSVNNFVVFLRLVHGNHFSLVKSYDSRKRHPFIYTALSRNLSRQIPQKCTIHLVVYGK